MTLWLSPPPFPGITGLSGNQGSGRGDFTQMQAVGGPWVAATKTRAQTHGEAPVWEILASWRGLQWMLTSVCV